LDALAHIRRERGLPATSLAWGLWENTAGMAGGLGESQLAQLERMGAVPLSDDEGLELFDQSLGAEAALLAPVCLDAATLRVQAQAGMLPALLRGLVRTPARPAEPTGGSLAQRLAGADPADREQAVLDLVRTQAAAVLGHASAASIGAERPFKDLGFDSLGAVGLRNRLTQATGVRLPATLIFDHPTPAAVARLLLAELGGGEEAAEPSIDAELKRLENLLAAAAEEEKQRVAGRLRALATALSEAGESASGRIEAAESVDEVFRLIDAEFGEA
ncbi:phosphopantetheine-binding protein, partial [Streptomyces sp. JJ38]|uniref:phosphopantetheine-binding protein n=1 Tax=Streptomyces sp. JJ38 TaxID=2738128 RepID=UPI00214AEC26